MQRRPPYNLMKYAAHKKAQSLILNINMMFNEDIFPENLKTIDIKPIFKKYNKEQNKNYRAVALLSNFFFCE